MGSDGIFETGSGDTDRTAGSTEVKVRTRSVLSLALRLHVQTPEVRRRGGVARKIDMMRRSKRADLSQYIIAGKASFTNSAEGGTCISLLPTAPPTVSLMLPMVLSTLPLACATRQRCNERQINARE